MFDDFMELAKLFTEIADCMLLPISRRKKIFKKQLRPPDFKTFPRIYIFLFLLYDTINMLIIKTIVFCHLLCFRELFNTFLHKYKKRAADDKEQEKGKKREKEYFSILKKAAYDFLNTSNICLYYC